MFGRLPNKPRMRGQRPRVIYVSVGHAGAGETHAGRNGEGELAAGPGCHEGEWSHTGVTGTYAFKSVSTIQARSYPRATPASTARGHTSPPSELFAASPLGTVTSFCQPLLGADPLSPAMWWGGPGSPLFHPQDLAQCVNEVKRDNETLRQITNFQLSIENLVRRAWPGPWPRGEGVWSPAWPLTRHPVCCVGPVSGPLWPTQDRWRAQDHFCGAALQDGQVGGASTYLGWSLDRGGARLLVRRWTEPTRIWSEVWAGAWPYF